MAAIRVYQLKAPNDDSAFGVRRYAVLAEASHTVSSLQCPACGEVRSTWGLSYPAVDVTKLPAQAMRYLLDPDGEARRDPLSLDEYRDLEALLAPLLGPGRPLAPFAEFGPRRGKAEGLFDDFVWRLADPGVVVRRSAFDAMLVAGFKLTGVEPKLEYRRPRHDPLVEIEALPSVRVRPKDRRKPCKTCGFARGRVRGFKLDGESYDDSIPLQRVFERPEVVIANARLAQFIRDRNLSGAELVETDVA